MKVCIAMPCRDHVNTGFAYDLARLSAYWSSQHLPNGDELMFLTSMGTLIANQREELAEQAIVSGADWILWLDTDMRFPKDTLDRLLAHKEPIVAANYATRRIPVKTVAFDFVESKWECVYTKPEDTGLREVVAVGMGVFLVDTNVLKSMPKPWFHIGYSLKSGNFSGEDIHFCKQARIYGTKVLIDQDLSKEVKHIGTFEFSHDHAEACLEDV